MSISDHRKWVFQLELPVSRGISGLKVGLLDSPVHSENFEPSFKIIRQREGFEINLQQDLVFGVQNATRRDKFNFEFATGLAPEFVYYAH